MRTVDGFTSIEAWRALDYCRRNIRVQQIYLERDREMNPLSDHEYSHWKLREAHEDLRRAEARVKAFGIPFNRRSRTYGQG